MKTHEVLQSSSPTKGSSCFRTDGTPPELLLAQLQLQHAGYIEDVYKHIANFQRTQGQIRGIGIPAAELPQSIGI